MNMKKSILAGLCTGLLIVPSMMGTKEKLPALIDAPAGEPIAVMDTLPTTAEKPGITKLRRRRVKNDRIKDQIALFNSAEKEESTEKKPMLGETPEKLAKCGMEPGEFQKRRGGFSEKATKQVKEESELTARKLSRLRAEQLWNPDAQLEDVKLDDEGEYEEVEVPEAHQKTNDMWKLMVEANKKYRKKD